MEIRKMKVKIMKYDKRRGWDDNSQSDENRHISPKLMRLPPKHTYTSKSPYPGVEKESKALRNKRP